VSSPAPSSPDTQIVDKSSFTWEDGTAIKVNKKAPFTGISFSAVSFIEARVQRIRSLLEDIASAPIANIDDSVGESFAAAQLDSICLLFDEVKAEMHRMCPPEVDPHADALRGFGESKIPRILEEKMAICSQLRASIRRRDLLDADTSSGQRDVAQRERRKVLLRDDMIRRLHRRLAAAEREAEWERQQLYEYE
jgi:hypothetical protein